MTNAAPTGQPRPTGQIVVCPDGPLLVRGPVEIVDASGNAVPRRRQTIALCRCGKSRIPPFCDGTHKLVRPRPTPTAPSTDDP